MTSPYFLVKGSQEEFLWALSAPSDLGQVWLVVLERSLE